MPEKRKNQNDGGLPLKRIGICSLTGAALFFIALIGFSALELKMAFGGGLYLPVGIVSAIVSSFIAGFAAVFKDKKKAVPVGAITGVIEAAIADIVLILINNGDAGKGLIFMNLSALLGAVVGAVAAANIRPKIRY